MLGIQALEIASISVWTAVTSYLLFKLIDLIVGLRLGPEEEEVGLLIFFFFFFFFFLLCCSNGEIIFHGKFGSLSPE